MWGRARMNAEHPPCHAAPVNGESRWVQRFRFGTTVNPERPAFWNRLGPCCGFSMARATIVAFRVPLNCCSGLGATVYPALPWVTMRESAWAAVVMKAATKAATANV